MNNSLSKALNERLSVLFSDIKVFSGHARNADLPYVQFNVNTVMDEIEFAALPISGNIYYATVQIDFYYKNYKLANDSLEEAKVSLIEDVPELEKGSILNIYVTDFEVLEEEELTESGERVYRGLLLLEVRLIHG